MNITKVPFGNLARDEKETLIDGKSLDSLIKKNILQVIEKKDFILGGFVEQFESNFADYCGVKHCIGVSSGLSSLELSLRGLGIGYGDEVITVANTFNATVGAIVKAGATPILVDADPRNFNINIDKIKSEINNKTKAIIPVHLYGQTVNMDKLGKIAREYDLFVIEDACQSHGSMFNNQRAGSFGNAGCFSFYPGKNLGAFGDAGTIITNEDNLADFLRKTRNYGQTRKYQHDVWADNSRLDTIQAAVLIEKLKILDKWNKMRIENAEVYKKELGEISEVKLPSERKAGEHIYHLFVIKAERRNELEKYLSEIGIQSGKHYPIPIHLQPCFSNLEYRCGDFPISEELAENILSLPMFPTLKIEEIKYVSDSIKNFYSKNK